MGALLIEDAAVLTLDESDRFIERGSILIEGGRISQVGEVDRGRAERVIDGRRFLAMPGLVNAHTHTPGALSAGTVAAAAHAVARLCRHRLRGFVRANAVDSDGLVQDLRDDVRLHRESAF